MAINMLYNTVRGRKGKIGNLEIEATLSENHDMSSTVTKYTIENGANISDHIVNEPETITIEGFVSNSPVAPGLGGGLTNRAQETFDTLYELRNAKEVITVVTEYRVYTDMAITNISIPRDSSTGQAIRFSVSLMRVYKAGGESQSLSSVGFPTSIADGLASAQKILGKVTSSSAPLSAVSKATSVVKGLFG